MATTMRRIDIARINDNAWNDIKRHIRELAHAKASTDGAQILSDWLREDYNADLNGGHIQFTTNDDYVRFELEWM